MKTIKQLLESGQKVKDEKAITEAYGTDHLSKADLSRPMGFVRGDRDVPTVLILKRKAIRVYPDNQKVALYYSQQLDKYVSIPFGPNAKNMGNALNERTLPPTSNNSDDDEPNPFVRPGLAAKAKEFEKQNKAKDKVLQVAQQSKDWHAAKDKQLYQAKKQLNRNSKNTNAYKLGRATRLATLRAIAKVTGAKSPIDNPPVPVQPEGSK